MSKKRLFDLVFGIFLIIVLVFLCGLAAYMVWFSMGFATGQRDLCDMYRAAPITNIPYNCLQKWGMAK